VQLQASRAVDEIEECCFARVASRGDPARDSVSDRRLLTSGEAFVGALDRRERFGTREVVGKRLDALSAQPFKLGSPSCKELGETVILPAHRGEAT
jgi:hypothetical protein